MHASRKYHPVNYRWAEDPEALAMNLDQQPNQGRTQRSSSDFKRFRAVRRFTTPRGIQDLPEHHRSIANVRTRNSVRISAAPAAKAPKLQAISVTLIHMPAQGATSTGIPRINQFEVDALGSGFVRNKELSLGIRPTIDPTPKILSLADTGVANVRQFFHNDTPCSDTVSPLYKPLRGTMQEMVCHGSLVSRQALQKPVSGTGAYRLYSGSGLSDVLASRVKPSAVEEKCPAVIAVGSRKKSLNSAINSNDTASSLGFWNLNFVSQNQIPLAVAFLESRSLPSSVVGDVGMLKRYWLAPKSDTLLGHRKVSLPNNRISRAFEPYFSPQPFGFISSMRSSNSAKGTQGELGRKSEVSSNNFVMLSRQGTVIKFLGFKNNGTDPIASRKKLGAVLFDGNCRVADLDFGCSDCFQQLLLQEKALKVLQENTIVCKSSNHNQIGDGNSSARLKT